MIGSANIGGMVLAIDFDGTLVEHDVMPLRWRPGAKRFLLGAAAAGVRIWLHSCRNTPSCIFDRVSPADSEEYWRSGRVQEDVAIHWRLFAELRAFLEAEGVWSFVQLWTLPGKPMAWHYIDDLSDKPDWPRLSAEFGIQLPVVDSSNAEQRGDPALGATRVAPGPIASTVPTGPSVDPVAAAAPTGLGIQT